ncbi:hypothetical protein Taro_047576 [Colocasia esculenta]|uniref:Uncharacterized protein n=1 Tax=Colocasia esculenta TaxID=4460 RepID=A0A843WVT3_COLES|nr:hypothetical protein [Colocasia esculenta]
MCSGRRAKQAEVHRLVALCSGGGFPELFVVVLVSVSLRTVSRSFLLLLCSSEFEVCGWFGWCILEGFSQSGALVVLVEVLPRPACVASTVLLAAVFSLMVRVVWSFGLCILVNVLPRIALCRFWWRFFPGVLHVYFGPPLCCSCGLKCAVWLGRILMSCRCCLCPWPCVWLPRWPACLVVRFQVSRPRWRDLCVPVA